jgi:hypothetical protein
MNSESNKDDRLQTLLVALANELRRCNELRATTSVEYAAAGENEQRISFLQSNELWGGSGSIADQAGVGAERSEGRRRIERALRDLGLEQIRLGIANPRTAMWVDAFTKWADTGL